FFSLLLIVSRYSSHRDLHSFPTRRSSDLSHRRCVLNEVRGEIFVNRFRTASFDHFTPHIDDHHLVRFQLLVRTLCKLLGRARIQDRKSTRLNSSHVAISYAVFCLKKKKKN